MCNWVLRAQCSQVSSGGQTLQGLPMTLAVAQDHRRDFSSPPPLSVSLPASLLSPPPPNPHFSSPAHPPPPHLLPAIYR